MDAIEESGTDEAEGATALMHAFARHIYPTLKRGDIRPDQVAEFMGVAVTRALELLSERDIDKVN